MKRIDARYAECVRGKDIVTRKDADKDRQRVLRSGRASAATRLATRLVARLKREGLYMICPRCRGLVVDEYGDRRCLVCGYHDAPPLEPQVCKGTLKTQGRCVKAPARGSDYCQQCEKLEAKHRKASYPSCD